MYFSTAHYSSVWRDNSEILASLLRIASLMEWLFTRKENHLTFYLQRISLRVFFLHVFRMLFHAKTEKVLSLPARRITCQVLTDIRCRQNPLQCQCSNSRCAHSLLQLFLFTHNFMWKMNDKRFVLSVFKKFQGILVTLTSLLSTILSQPPLSPCLF